MSVLYVDYVLGSSAEVLSFMTVCSFKHV